MSTNDTNTPKYGFVIIFWMRLIAFNMSTGVFDTMILGCFNYIPKVICFSFFVILIVTKCLFIVMKFRS